MVKPIKKFIIHALLTLAFLKCRISFWLYGPYGVANILQTAPFPFIQPILIKYGAKIGRNCVIDTGMVIHRPDKAIPFKNLIIGDNCYIGHNNLFDLSAIIHIEHDVGIGAYCQFWTHVGDYKDELTNRIDDYKENVASIRIGMRTVLYSGVIVSPGINVGEYARVGAGSVLTTDLPDNAFYAGAPAKKIRDL